MANADFVSEGSLEKSERWCILTTREMKPREPVVLAVK